MNGLASLDPVARTHILALRAAGKPFHAIAALLNQLGLRGQAGGRWYGASIRRVLKEAGQAGPHRCTARCLEHQRPCARLHTNVTHP